MPPTPAISSGSILHYTDDGSTDDEYCIEDGTRAYDAQVWQDGDQDWTLCDKDCGWCGHCADSVDY